MWARKCASVSLSDDALAFQWPPLVFCSLSHFKTTSVTVPELGVGETAVAASPGGSIVARRVGTGWMTHWKCFFVFLFFFVGQLWEGSSFFFLIYLFIFNLICISRALPTHPLSCARSQAQTHTFSHMKRVREGEMLDQTDSFGLGKKDSSYL